MKVILYACLLILISSNNLRNTANWDFNSMYSELIVQHNILRKKHKASPLTKLVAIQNLAKKTAEGCAKLGKLQHTKDYYDNQPVGQNLYMSLMLLLLQIYYKDGTFQKNLIMIMEEENLKMVESLDILLR